MYELYYSTIGLLLDITCILLLIISTLNIKYNLRVILLIWISCLGLQSLPIAEDLVRILELLLILFGGYHLLKIHKSLIFMGTISFLFILMMEFLGVFIVYAEQGVYSPEALFYSTFYKLGFICIIIYISKLNLNPWKLLKYQMLSCGSIFICMTFIHLLFERG